MEKILQLKIALSGIKPEIWRRFQVKDSITFEEFHEIIQDIMGWEDYHLYEFKFGNTRIILPDEGYLEENELDPKKVKIGEYIDKEKQKFEYVYDFGDSWEHEIDVEKITEDKIEDADEYPKCMDGERACPPEDCGGVCGYEELLEVRNNKNHPRYEELIIDWLGEDFNPEEFNAEEINNIFLDEGADEEEYSEEDGKAFKEELIKDFVPLNKLLLEDNDKIKKLKSLFKKEGEYGFLLGSIEIPIKSYYQFNKDITDKEVVKMLENIKENYDKDVRFFDKELEQMIMCMLSLSLKAKKITHHELMLAIDYILWSISNRGPLGPTGYLDWLLEFFPSH